jgi:two-component system phosphate regulon sensor histidine kinase PhoR
MEGTVRQEPPLPVATAATPAIPGSGSTAPIWPAILEGLSDPALVLDGLGHVIGTNAPVRALMSVATGRHISHTARSPELLDAVATVLRTRRQVACSPRLLASADRAFTALVTPLSTSASIAEPAVLVVARDLTEQERLARLRSDFVANASHELRTPLTAVKGFVETLQGPAKDDPVARDRFLRIIAEQANRMARLIDDLLSLSRVEMNEHVRPQGRVDLAPLVADVTRALSKVADDAGVTLIFAPKAVTAAVIGDRDELVQVAQNLIENGIKYGRRGGRVSIRLEPKGARVGLVIEDDGIGIAPEHLPRLVERFYRVNASASRERGGTGLGLAIVKHIVARHAGQLDIQSTLGKGSTCTVWLPAAKSGDSVTKV